MKKTFIFLLALVMALGVSLVATMPVAADPGTTYYVDTTGSDETGDGSWHTPWKTVQHAISQVASGDTIEMAPGTYVEVGQIVISNNLTITGTAKETTIIKPAQDTGSSGDARGWFLVQAGTEFNLSDVTLDGSGKKVYQGIRDKGSGTIADCSFNNIQYEPSTSYAGLAMAVFGNGNVDVTGCTFTGIGRVGVLYYGTGVTGSTFNDNTYTGKGSGDWLDYGVEVGGGATASITDNTITNCLGVASDDSTSAGILVTDYYGPGTEATITGNTLTDNTMGIALGYDDSDLSVATISGNTFENNRYQVDSTPNVDVDLEATLAGNTFDRAVVVRGSGIKVPTIFSNIQDAIDAASPGDTIEVLEGTYVEDLVIPAGKDGLELKGAGCNLTVIKGVATSDGTPVYNIRFDEFDGVSGVKIHGFTIESPDVPTNHSASGMVLNGQDIEIYDNCFVSKGAESAEGNYCVAVQTWRWSAAPDSDITGLKIYNNTFSSEGDLWVYQGVFVNRDGEDFGDVTVSGNNFSGNVHMGIAYEGNNAVISNNEMTSTYEGVGIAIMDWAELEQNDVDVDGNELQGFNYGVLVGRGAQVMTNITVANNDFSNNLYQVRDRADTLNLDDVLAGNTFDRAVVVRGSGIKVPTIFSSIQDAIDAAVAGDTVDVADGTYTEQLTISNKGLTITGESESGVIVQAGTTAPGSSNVFTIDAAGKDITIQNMTIRNGLYGIRSSAGDVNVLHCTFYHNGYDGSPYAAPPTQENAAAMWASGHTTDGGAMRIQNSGSSEIAYCTAYENARGIRFQDGDNGNIHDCVSYNNIESGIYLASNTYTGTAGCTNTVIRDCESYGNMNNGILVIGGRNITVESNNVHDNWNTGIMLWHPSEVVIENNTITHNNLYSFNGVGNAGDDEGGIWMDGATAMTPLSFVCKILNNTISDTQLGGLSEKVGINVDDVYDSSIVIEHNTFSDHDIDVWVQYEAATTVVNYNNFGTDYGIKNDDISAILDGRFNWWGDASGPYHATSNPSGTGDAVSDNVDYSPWWGDNYIGVAHPWEWYTNDSIQDAIDAASAGDTINVMAGTYVEVGQIVISNNLTIIGEDKDTTIIKPAQDTGGSGDARGWFLVEAGNEFNLSNVTLDGEGKNVHQAIRSFGSGTIDNNIIKNIRYSLYIGFGMVVMGDYNMTFSNNTFTDIERIGMMAFGSGVTDAQIIGNTYTGKGDVDGLDYGIEIGGGAKATITGNNITNCTAVASSDGSESAGILVTDYWGPGTEATITGNTLTGNTMGIAIGYDGSDLSVATISGNTLENNRYQVDCTASVDVDLEATLANNTFDRAVVVRGSGIKVSTIFSSIQDAIDAASAGDTIEVAAGTYVEDLFIDPDKADLELKGAGANTTTIKGTTVGVAGVPNINVHADGVKIHDFTIETADGAGSWVDGLILNGVDVEIYDNHFKVVSSVATGNAGAAIQTWRSENVALQNIQFGFDPPRDSDVSGLNIYDNEFSGVGVERYMSIWVNRDEGVGLATISGNIMNGPIHRGIGTERSNTLIENNVIESTYAGPSGIIVYDWNDREQEDVAVTGNTVSGFDTGIVIGGDAQSLDDVSVTENTVQDNGTGIEVCSSAGGVVVNYNNIVGNVGGATGLKNTDTAWLDGRYNWWGAATGPYHDPLNPGGEGDTVSDNVLFEPWYGDEGMTTLVGHSTYEFVYDVPEVIVALEETVVPVTFQTDELGVVGYYDVRFKFNATGPGDVIFKATDSEEVEHTFVNSGFWGPSAGFNLTADYSATTDWSLNFSEPGEYNITFSLIEAPDGDVVAGIEDSEDITVRAVDILDHYRYLHEPYDEVTTLDLLAAADDWIANDVPPGFDDPITTMQLLALADEWYAS